MGLYSAIEGMGSFLGVLLIQLTQLVHLGWIKDEAHFNQSHLDYYFYLLSLVQLLATITLGLILYVRSVC